MAAYNRDETPSDPLNSDKSLLNEAAARHWESIATTYLTAISFDESSLWRRINSLV